jgi:hypothetical protein
MICKHCEEPIEPGEEAPTVSGGSFHRDCLLRLVIGSVAHQERRCHCFVPGSTAGDPPGMTLREAARAAVELYRQKHRMGPNGLNLPGRLTG